MKKSTVPKAKAAASKTRSPGEKVMAGNNREEIPVSEPAKKHLEHILKERVTRALDRAINNMGAADLEKALAAPTDTGSVAHILSNSITMDEAVRSLDPLALAMMRGVEMKRELLQEAGGALTTAQVTELLDISRQAIQQRARRGNLLAIDTPSGEMIFPAIQFTDSGTIPHLEKALQAFRMKDSWMRLSLLLDVDEEVDGQRVIDALRKGQIDDVLEAIRSFGI